MARTVADTRRIVESGKKAILIGWENAYPLTLCGSDHEYNLKIFGKASDKRDCGKQILEIKAGAHYVGLTHFGHNQFADSSNPHPQRDKNRPRHNGVSEQGRDLIKTLNKFGIMVDVSHASKASMMQAADLSTTPIIASHSGAKAIGDHPRNLDDEQLRKIAAIGGVAQMVAFDAYVKPFTSEQKAFQKSLREELGLETADKRRSASEEVKAEYKERIKAIWDIKPRATIADFVDHIDHAVKVAGINHVGIASDFDGGGGLDGWEDASQTANVTAELLRRGYSEGDIAKIWGENLLRVMAAAQSAAQSHKTGQ